MNPELVKRLNAVGPEFQRLLTTQTLSNLDNYLASLHTMAKHTDMIPITSKIITRQEWGAKEPRERKTQKIPVEHLVITWTYTDPCNTQEECVKSVQKIQKDQMKEGSSDIKYNFLAGGDGNLYEGRGWNTESEYPKTVKDCDQFRGNSIQVAFINQPTNKPTYAMLKAIATIVTIGDTDQYLVKKVKYARFMHEEVLSFKF